MNKYLSLLVVLLSLTSAYSAAGPWGNIIYDEFAVTYKGAGQPITLEPLKVGDNTQQWRVEDNGLIVSKVNTAHVFEVSGGKAKKNAVVIAGIRAATPPLSQLWTVNNISISSKLAAGLYVKARPANFVVVDYASACPFAFKFSEIYLGPYTCSSYGDPHFTCWNGGKFDYQFVGTVLLAKFNDHIIQAVQVECGNGNVRVACNLGVVILAQQTTQAVQITSHGQISINGNFIPDFTGTYVVNANVYIQKLATNYYRTFIPGGYVSIFNEIISVTVTAGYLQNSLCLCPPYKLPDTITPQHEFGLSQTIKNVNDSIYTYPPEHPFTYNPGYNATYGPITTDDPELLANATQHCQPLSKTGALTVACQKFVNSTEYYNSCLNDVIGTGKTENAQESIRSYSVQCSDLAIKNQSVVVLPTDAGSSIAYGSGLNGSVLITINQTFTIQARDTNGKNRTVGGDNFVVTNKGPATLSFTIVDKGDGTYSVSYTAYTLGVYEIKITLGGNEISDSPWDITVIPRTWFYLVYQGKAVTWQGTGLQLKLQTLVPNTPAQLWRYDPAGFIVTNVGTQTQVFDVKDGTTTANAPVITYARKSSGFTNQQWNISTTPYFVESRLKSGFYLRSSNNNIIVNYDTPAQEFYFV